MSNFEEIKKYMEWRTRKRRKWYLFGLSIVLFGLGLCGLKGLMNAASYRELSLVGNIGVGVLVMTWTIGGIICMLLLGSWAQKESSGGKNLNG